MDFLKYLLVVIGLSGYSFGQTTFFKLFSDNGYDYGYDIIQNQDSSYFFVGSSSSFSESSQGFLAKIDKFGIYQWSKNYGGGESEVLTSINRTSTGELLLSGYSNSYTLNGNYDFMIVRTDEQGVELSKVTFGTNSWDFTNSADLDQNDNLYLAGKTFNTTDGKGDMYLVKCNNLGDTLWTKQFANVGEDEINRILIDSDTTFIVCGSKYNWAEEKNKGYVGRFYQDGTLIWEVMTGTLDNYFYKDIVKDTVNDTFFCVGEAVLASNDVSFYQSKFDLNGNELLTITANEVGVRSARVACFYTVNYKLLVGEHFDNQYSVGEGYDMFFQQYDSNYNWEGGISHYNNIEQDEVLRLIPTNDLGAIAIGYTTYQGKGGANVFVLKFGPNGEEPTYSNSGVQTIVSISEVDANKEFSVYPNPASSEICVSTYLDEELSLYDLNAKRIATSKNACLDISTFENGVYLLEVKKGGVSMVQKVIISN